MLWIIKMKVKQVHVVFLVVFSVFGQFSILKKCNMKRVQREKSATWKWYGSQDTCEHL